MDISTAVAAVEGLKKIIDVFQKAGKIDLVNIIVATQQQLLGMQSRIATLEAENVDLQEKLKTKGNLVHENNAYYIIREEGKRDGPFCTRCWDKNKDVIRLHPAPHSHTYKQCPECGRGVHVG